MPHSAFQVLHDRGSTSIESAYCPLTLLHDNILVRGSHTLPAYARGATRGPDGVLDLVSHVLLVQTACGLTSLAQSPSRVFSAERFQSPSLTAQNAFNLSITRAKPRAQALTLAPVLRVSRMYPRREASVSLHVRAIVRSTRLAPDGTGIATQFRLMPWLDYSNPQNCTCGEAFDRLRPPALRISTAFS